jgi:hypothetical protein
MANGNGTKSAIAVIVFVGAILGSGITIYSVFHAPLARAIAEETVCRTEKDEKLQAQMNLYVKEQMMTNQQILIALAEIKENIKARR